MKLYYEDGPRRIFKLEPAEDGQDGLALLARMMERRYEDLVRHPDFDNTDYQFILDVMREEGPDYWQGLYEETDSANFITFIDKEPVGWCATSENWLQGNFVLFAHRNQGLGQAGIAARLRSLAEDQAHDFAQLWIHPENIASIKAVINQGFQFSGHHTCNPEDGPMNMYRRDLKSPVADPVLRPHTARHEP